MDLTVVVASIDARSSVQTCVRRLETACAGIQAEILVLDASVDDTAARAAAAAGYAQVYRLTPGMLTPQLWAEGLRRAHGRIVAFTTAHCLVSPGWARALMEAIDGGAAAAGGPFVIAGGTRPLDWAVFYLRYSHFVPSIITRGRLDTGEIAGDNAAYAHAALVPHAKAVSDGFWEVEVHRLIRGAGGWLAGVPEAVVEFGRSFSAGTIVKHRFAHGRQFGAERVREKGTRTMRVVAAAPVVPFVLLARAANRVKHEPARWRFVAAIPWFLVLAGSWAAGEAWGAVTSAPRERSCASPQVQ